MLIILRSLLFFTSILGLVIVTKLWLKTNRFTSYIFVFCSIGITVFFCGIINFLEQSVYIIFGVGLILFLYFLIIGKIKEILKSESLSLINIAFVLITSVICIILLNTKFIHYDNFSHWGMVVKYMLMGDTFPDINTALIEFSDYPLGASSFIYYVCKIVGNTQGIMLFGQSLLIFAGFYSMFGIISERKRSLLYVVLALGLCTTSFFNIAIRMNNLLVDFLLPILALSAISVIYSNRNNFTKACIVVTPILGLLSVVKNTGIFFVFTCLCYLIFVAICKGFRGSNKLKLFFSCCSTILFSTLPILIWKLYFDIKFEGIETKFDINQNTIEQATLSKTAEQISEIVKAFFSEILDLGNPVTIAFIVINIIGITAYFVAKYGIKKKWYLLKVVFLTDILVVVYYIGLLGMYIFLMPLDEATRLAGVERYVCSIIIYQLGCVAICATLDIERSFHIKMGSVYDPRGFKSIHTKNLCQKATLVFVVLAIMILTSEMNGLNYIKEQYNSSLPGRISELIPENKDSQNHSRYLVYASDNDGQISSYYLQYIFRYILFAPNVDAIYDVAGRDLLKELQGYDYLIVFESDRNFEASINNSFKTQISEGTYKIVDNKLQFVKP